MTHAPTTMRRHRQVEAKGGRVVLGALDPAYRYGRTIFSSRVFDPDEVQRVLKTGHQSRKIGAFSTRAPRKGWPIFTLTLEERATCPRNCKEWGTCYGSSMQAAERIVHGPALEAALHDELAVLQGQHPAGFMVRLHVLGDFYSEQYLACWRSWLSLYPALHVFGFTAHTPESEMGKTVTALTGEYGWPRFAIRFSGAEGPKRASRVLSPGETDADAITCPAQLKKADGRDMTECCGTCMLCVNSDASIAFLRH